MQAAEYKKSIDPLMLTQSKKRTLQGICLYLIYKAGPSGISYKTLVKQMPDLDPAGKIYNEDRIQKIVNHLAKKLEAIDMHGTKWSRRTLVAKQGCLEAYSKAIVRDGGLNPQYSIWED